jgi:hypothetical protein
MMGNRIPRVNSTGLKVRNNVAIKTNGCHFSGSVEWMIENKHMLIKRFFLICSLPSLLAGCSGFYGSQPPAPVYGGGTTVYTKPMPSLPKPAASKPVVPAPVEQNSTETVKIKPLKSGGSITPIEMTPEPLMPVTPEEAREPFVPGQKGLKSEPVISIPGQETPAPGQELPVPGQEPATAPPPQESAPAKPAPKPVVSAPKQELLPPPLPPFEPLDSFAPLSPAVGALALAANQNTQSGNIGSATTTIERAIRIEPRNATLYYKLALLRLKQSKPRLAEDLAKKAALLASNDAQLKKHSWLLVARARELQGDIKGGKEARAKAGKF